MSHDVEPLETGVWLVQLRNLAMRRSRGEVELAASLRRAFHLAQLAPRPLHHLVGCPLPESEFERLLESETLLPAALGLLGNGFNYTVSPMDGAGETEAEVWFSNECHGASASGSSAAAALFTAWLDCLLALDPIVGFGATPPNPPIRRKCLSERRPRLTEH